MTNPDSSIVALVALPIPELDPAAQFPTESPVEWLDFNKLSESELSSRADEVDVVVGMGHGDFDMPDLHGFTNLRAFLSASVGVEGLTPQSIPDGCLVSNTYEHERPIADWVIMATTMLSRKAVWADRSFRDGTIKKWLPDGAWLLDLSEATIGVIGLGHIGNAVVELASAHLMNCVAVSGRQFSAEQARSSSLSAVYGRESLHDMLAIADFVVPAVPLNEQTRGLIGEPEYRAMKDTAHIINVSRAEVLDEEATYRALKDGLIAGGAIDVWWNEDTEGFESDDIERKRWSRYPFWELDNVLMSPHWSNLTSAMFTNKSRFIGRQIDRLARDEPLQNVISELSRV